MAVPVKMEEALRQLADPENWIGDPMTLDAEFTGHFTPFELACEALADEEDEERPSDATDDMNP